ncbi:hypothetical protein Hanom_Chr02g00102911 [Helianthus anomalus]
MVFQPSGPLCCIFTCSNYLTITRSLFIFFTKGPLNFSPFTTLISYNNKISILHL